MDWTEAGFLLDQKLAVILHIYILHCIKITVSLDLTKSFLGSFISTLFLFTELAQDKDNHF